MPLVRKYRQSASFWFQCASVESFNPAVASRASSLAIARCSISAIAHLVFRGLAETWHRARHPVRGPFDEPAGIDDGQTEQFHRLRGVGKPRGGLLFADKDGCATEQLAELAREVAYRQNLVPADIDRRGRRVAVRKAAQRLRSRVALPDEVDMAKADIDRLTGCD